MKAGTTRLKLVYVLLFLVLGSLNGFAQKQTARVLIDRIDSLAAVGLPKSALAQVDKLDQLYRQNNNAPGKIKATFYRLTFLSYLKEEAIISVIQRLKQDIAAASYPVKPVLQSLLADMYLRYYQQNRYQFSQRSQLAEPSPDFTQWDLRTIFQQVSVLHQAALQDEARLQKTPISVLGEAMEGDSLTRHLRPTLYDLLVHRALDFYLNEESGLPQPAKTFSLNNPDLFSDSRTFATLSLPTQDTSSHLYKGLKLLQQATRFHLTQNNQEALADLDLKRLQVLQSKATFQGHEALYLSRLQEIAATVAGKPISADALYLLGKYHKEKDNLNAALPFLEKAIASFPKSLGGRNASILQKEILQKNLSIQVESTVPSDHAILALATYKNLSTANSKVYRLSEEQYENLTTYQSQIGRYAQENSTREARRKILALLEKLKVQQVQTIPLPNPGDHRNHRVEFKIDALTPGIYALLAQGGEKADTSLLEISTFKVSDLAYTSRTNPDGKVEVRVVHRVTGKPLSQVQVTAMESTWGNGKQESIKVGEGLTDQSGKIIFPTTGRSHQLTFSLVSGKDKFTDVSQNLWGALAQNEQQHDEEHTILFTDRQIYRPGQTIYFKGIQIKQKKGTNELVAGAELEVELSDVNDETIGKLDVKTNEYGSFSGSFQLPANMLTGQVTLEADDGQLEIQVEEYKRPSFAVSFDSVKESYRLKDSVKVKGNVKAFAGYGLSSAQVQYKVIRQPVYQVRPYGVGRKRSYQREEMEVQSGTVTTNASGVFEISFKAVAEVEPDFPEQQYRYIVTATATDASGETQEQSIGVRVGQKVLELTMFLPKQVLLPDSLHTLVQFTNLNGQVQAGKVLVQIFKLTQPERPYKNRLWEMPDTSTWQKEEFEKLFPAYAPIGLEEFQNWPVGEEVFTRSLTIAQKPVPLHVPLLNGLKSGIYLVLAQGVNQSGDSVTLKQYVTLVSRGDNVPARMQDWVIPVNTTAEVGKNAVFLVGAGKSHVLVEVYNGPVLEVSRWVTTGSTQERIEIPMKATYGEQAQVQFLMVQENRVYTKSHKISSASSEPSLALRFTTFRNTLLPGQKENWKLQVTDLQNKGAAAEMVASLYDASLDKIAPPQDWYSAFTSPFNYYQPDYFNWASHNFLHSVTSQPLLFTWYKQELITRNYEHLSYFGYNYFGGYNRGYREYLQRAARLRETAKADQALEAAFKRNAAKVPNGVVVTGRILSKNGKDPLPGVNIRLKGTSISTTSNSKGYYKIKAPLNSQLQFSFIGYSTKTLKVTKAGNLNVELAGDGNSLNEVVVVGNGAVYERKEVTGAVASVAVRGQATVADALQSRAPGIEISLEESEKAASPKSPAPVTIRKNFQETAFFFPQLVTDKKGTITMEFTVPEALTRWNFKGLAHTKDFQWGYLTGEVVTQKKLMVSPYLPRFLREGDTITVSARIANLTAESQTGKVHLQFFNALNNQPVPLFLQPSAAEQAFTVGSGATAPVFFQLVIPGNIGALTYRITAQTKDFSDGEENTLPVLPNAVLVTESLPLMVRAGQTKRFTMEKLVQPQSTTLQSQTLIFEYTQNPIWTAVQALPYLMEYPYECSEQIFSRYYANRVATSIVQKAPHIKKVFDQWKATDSQQLLSELEKNQELKQTLITETPWLRDALSETEQKKRIALLFDLNKMEYELTQNLEKLAKLQYANGSFPWFAGMRPNRYISQHIMVGMGQLKKLGISPTKNETFDRIQKQALSYLEQEMTQEDKEIQKTILPKDKRRLHPTQIHAWYARSYFKEKALSPALQKAWARYQALAATEWKFQSIYEQGLLALTMHRFQQPALAQQIIKSLLERSEQSGEMGMYWPQNQRGYFWYQSPVETQVVLIELLHETGTHPKALSEMKLWLLRHKQTNNWRTTKATAAACYALLMKGEDWLSAPAQTKISLGGQPLLTLAPEVAQAAGSGYLKTSWVKNDISPILGQVEIKNEGTTASWGALHWQYLEKADKITASATQLKLKRQYFVQETTNGREVLVPVTAQRLPKVGGLLKVVIYLESDRDYEYVHLKDLRPAGTEPVDALSGYKGQDGLYYYQSTRDVATNFFIDRLGKGTFVFEYRLRVAHAGDFATGITTIQSMYAPEYNAHSEGSRISFGR